MPKKPPGDGQSGTGTGGRFIRFWLGVCSFLQRQWPYTRISAPFWGRKRLSMRVKTSPSLCPGRGAALGEATSTTSHPAMRTVMVSLRRFLLGDSFGDSTLQSVSGRGTAGPGRGSAAWSRSQAPSCASKNLTKVGDVGCSLVSPAARTPLLRPQMCFPGSPRGLLGVVVTLHLLWLGSAEFRVVGPGQPLHAIVGQDVVLPCHLSPAMDAHSLEIRWIRHRFSETVHLYQNGEDLYGGQMEKYFNRTELARDALSSGILDLRISGVRPSDDGQYVCTVQDADSYGEAMVELEVAAMGSVPHLSLEAHEDGGIRVVCRSGGWYPQPEVLWKGAGGQHLASLSQRRSSDERGLVEIQDVIVVPAKGDGDLLCVVRNSRLGQEQASSLHISAPFFHNAYHWMAALGVFLTLSVAVTGLSAYLWRRKWLQSRELEKQAAALEERDALLEERAALLGWRKFPLPKNLEVVTLDPNTAHCKLVLSEDLRSVRREREEQDLPYTPERFKARCCVLGREGFREGRHCWEVEVEAAGNAWWGVGVARESVERKEYAVLSPKTGIWAVEHWAEQFTSLTCPPTVLSPSLCPRRIWVCLDCTQGLVTFINAHNGVEIFTFPPATFNGETLRPWFWVVTEKTHLCLRGSTS